VKVRDASRCFELAVAIEALEQLCKIVDIGLQLNEEWPYPQHKLPGG
jgi:hypothetical protein